MAATDRRRLFTAYRSMSTPERLDHVAAAIREMADLRRAGASYESIASCVGLRSRQIVYAILQGKMPGESLRRTLVVWRLSRRQDPVPA